VLGYEWIFLSNGAGDWKDVRRLHSISRLKSFEGVGEDALF
jgi:hypothetical protein